MKHRNLILIITIVLSGLLFKSCTNNDDNHDSSAFKFDVTVNDIEQRTTIPKKGAKRIFTSNNSFHALSAILINKQRIEHDQLNDEFENEYFRYKIINKKIFEIEFFENKTDQNKIYSFSFRNHNYFQNLTFYQN